MVNSSPEKFNPGSPEEDIPINPETGMIVSHGHEYANTPRMRSFFRKAEAIRKSLPSVPDGHTRLWRGNRAGEIGQNPSFTNSLEGIALPFKEGYEGQLSYIDIPTEKLKEYECRGTVAPSAEFILPTELAKMAIVIEEITTTEDK